MKHGERGGTKIIKQKICMHWNILIKFVLMAYIIAMQKKSYRS